MAGYRFLILDVFSDTAFGGNQLAVLPDAGGISDEGLQAIAREFNFPESTFVLPAGALDCVRRVRIFTPQRELPFAGHPTVGTACALVAEGIAGEGQFRIEEGIGPVDVDVQRKADGLEATFTVRQAPDVHSQAAGFAEAAAAIGLTEVDVVRTFAGTLGPDFTFIQLRDAAAVDRAALDHAAWSAHFAGKPGAQLYLFSGELTAGARLYVRMFGPAFGIPEDPATGSAAALIAGAGALFSQAAGPTFSLAIDQGVAMGRPSRLEATALLEDGKVTAVAVGGATALVAEGIITVPDRYLLR